MPPNMVDPREWSAEGQVSDEQLARIVAKVTAAIPAPPPPHSPWTPAAVGALITALLTGIAGVIGVSQTRSSEDATRQVIRDAMYEHVRGEQAARDEITRRLSTTESQVRWAANGLCRVNGRPLHETQPCDAVVTEQDQGQTGRGIRVQESYPR